MSRKVTHGSSNTRLYHTYKHMKQRCNDKNSDHYHVYGARGITVCKEWQEFEPFKKWALENGYNDKLFIDRIDNEKGYSPDNCRWLTNKQQQNNRRDNTFLTYNGKTQTLAEWAEEAGLPYATFYARLKRGWSIADSITLKKGTKIK